MRTHPIHRMRNTGQQGNVVITVMISMLLIMLLVASLVEHYLVTESRAVEESLAKVRVYWAMSGHVDYIHSRVMRYARSCTADGQSAFTDAFNEFDFVPGQPSTCNTACDNDLDTPTAKEMIQCFVNDLETDQTADIRTWANYDGNANYSFAIRHLPGSIAGVGEIQFRLVNPGTIALLGDLDQRILPLHVRASLDGVTPPGLTILQYERF